MDLYQHTNRNSTGLDHDDDDSRVDRVESQFWIACVIVISIIAVLLKCFLAEFHRVFIFAVILFIKLSFHDVVLSYMRVGECEQKQKPEA
jgi:hypothetical protein